MAPLTDTLGTTKVNKEGRNGAQLSKFLTLQWGSLSTVYSFIIEWHPLKCWKIKRYKTNSSFCHLGFIFPCWNLLESKPKKGWFSENFWIFRTSEVFNFMTNIFQKFVKNRIIGYSLQRFLQLVANTVKQIHFHQFVNIPCLYINNVFLK